MKLSRWQLAAALGISLWSGTAIAQHTTGSDYGVAMVSDEPAAATAAKPAPPAVQASDCGCTQPGCTTTATCTTDGCTSGACESCAMECPEVAEPWRLFGHCNECNAHDLNFRGWVAGGMFGNFDSPASKWNGPVTFGDRDSEFQLNQLYLIGERSTVANTEAGDIALGGRVDVLYGTDYRFNIARGMSARDNFRAKWDTNRFYGLDVPQAYAEVGNKQLSAKIGRFYTLIGYQVFTAPDNFFYSIPYTFQYGEPFTHTGGLITYNANDQLSLYAGITNGWDNVEDVYNRNSVLAGATFTASDGNSKLAFAMHHGKEEVAFGALDPIGERWVYSVVYSRTITDRLSYVFQHDNGRQANYLASGEAAQWYGVNQYLFYKINCCWTAGLRAEWFRDDDGFRVAAPGDYAHTGASTNPASIGGWEGNFYNVALGLNYKPNANLTIRPEVRFDWYSGTDSVFAAGQRPFNDGLEDHQALVGFDVIYQY